jgi:CDP-glucose 4,6-dehydratase
MLKEKTVLVTGCAGFLGPWLCEQLLSAEATVIGIDKLYSEGSRIHELSEKVETLSLDIRDFDAVSEIIESRKVEVIYHLAAQALVGVASRDPLRTFKDNVEGTWNVLEAARLANSRQNRIKAIVVASSDKAYGDQADLPYLENAPMEGKYPYDVSKSCADLISRSYFHSFNLPVCVTRCGNLYGGGDLNMSRLVPGTIFSIYKKEAPIIRSNGKYIRDYIYVQDAAEAYVLISSKLLADAALAGECFNISNDSPVSVLDIVEKIQKIGGSTKKPLIENNAVREIEKQYLCSKKMQRMFNWRPKTGLNEGLKLAFKWYFQYFKDTEEGRTNEAIAAKLRQTSVP